MLVTLKTTIIAIQGYSDGLPRVSASHGQLNTILNIVIGIVAAVSVLFVVIGGMRYVLSAGDPQAASKARSTIIYAVIGLLVAIVAEGIVALVLDTILSNT